MYVYIYIYLYIYIYIYIYVHTYIQGFPAGKDRRMSPLTSSKYDHSPPPGKISPVDHPPPTHKFLSHLPPRPLSNG